MFSNFIWNLVIKIKINYIWSKKVSEIFFARTPIKHQFGKKKVFSSQTLTYEHWNPKTTCCCTAVWNKIEMAGVTTPVQQPAELVLQQRARGSGDRGRKWLLCLYVRRLAEGQAGFCCVPDFLLLFCLFTPCLSGFRKKLLLLCPLRKTKRKKNTSGIQSEDNAHKSIEEMSYQPGSASQQCTSFSQVF